MHKEIKSEKDMGSFAVRIAELSLPTDTILLNGNLGAGKTFFASSFINYFAPTEITVLSPTFNIVKTYEFDDVVINHFDLYRIKAEEELYEIGFEELISDSISLIEWGEIAKPLISKPYKEITIDFVKGKPNRRLVEVKEYL